MRKLCNVLAVFFALLGVGLPGAASRAQAAGGSGEQSSTLTVNARLVVLDVVVTDAKGKPVDGLTEKDFQVYEDGVVQHIRSLEPPSTHTLPEASIAAGTAQLFDPAHPASFGRSPVTVLLLDQANTHFADSSFARRQIHDYLASQPALLAQPTNLLSVYDNHFKQVHDFTLNRDALLEALKSAPTEYAWKLEINGNVASEDGPLERLDQSLRALEQIAQSYARIPGRKNLVWVGGGFPTLDPTALDGDDAQLVKDTLQHITDVLLDTRVTLYAVDPTNTAAGVTEISSPEQLAFAEAAGDTLTSGTDPFSTSQDFDRLGVVTGGRVVRGRNDVAQQISDSVNLGANFYTISYTPVSNNQAAAKYRKIKVVCLRPGLTATTRNGYYPNPTRQESATDIASYDLTAAAESALPLNGLHVDVQLDRSNDAPPNTYLVRVSAADLSWKPEPDGSSVASVYILAASLDANGKLRGHTTQAMKAIAKPGINVQDASHTAEFVFPATPTAKSRSLRFIVRDSATGKMGSMNLEMKKP